MALDNIDWGPFDKPFHMLCCYPYSMRYESKWFVESLASNWLFRRIRVSLNWKSYKRWKYNPPEHKDNRLLLDWGKSTFNINDINYWKLSTNSTCTQINSLTYSNERRKYVTATAAIPITLKYKMWFYTKFNINSLNINMRWVLIGFLKFMYECYVCKYKLR